MEIAVERERREGRRAGEREREFLKRMHLNMWAFCCPTPLLGHIEAFLIPSVQILDHRRTHNWIHCGKVQKHWEDISWRPVVAWIRLYTGKLRHQRKGEKIPWEYWRPYIV